MVLAGGGRGAQGRRGDWATQAEITVGTVIRMDRRRDDDVGSAVGRCRDRLY